MASYPEHYRNLLHLLRQHRQDLSQGLIPGLRRHARAGEQDAKLELDLPSYVVGKLKKGVRKKESGPYYLCYWQPKRDLRQAGFKSVPLGRDLGKAIEQAKLFNEGVKVWRSGGNLDPGRPPKLRGTIPCLIDLYQDSEDYRDKAPKTRLGYDRCLEILHRWSRAPDIPRSRLSLGAVCGNCTNH